MPKKTQVKTRAQRLDVNETTEDLVEDVPKRPNRDVSPRPTRTPVAGNRDRLSVKGLPEGVVPRWVNDVDDGSRIQLFLDAGYQFVTAKGLMVGDRTVETSTKDTGSIRTKNVGQGITAYLMALDRELYTEDQDAKHAEIDRTESTMFEDSINPEDRYGNINVSFEG